MKKRDFPLAEVYRLLEPGPVTLLTTSRAGRANVMTQSWHMMMDFEPPLVGLIVSDHNHSYKSLLSSGECVINIPTEELADAVVGCGNVSGRRFDKFAAFGLTPVRAARVVPPLIDECWASLECRVVDARWARRYGLFVVEVLKAWADRSRKNPRTLHHRGKGVFMVAGWTIKRRSRMK